MPVPIEDNEIKDDMKNHNYEGTNVAANDDVKNEDSVILSILN